jgi:hypothetical protein
VPKTNYRSKVETELAQLRHLWDLELEASRAAHRADLENTPFAERVRNGTALERLSLEDVQASGAGRCFLWFKVGKASLLEGFQLRQGSPVALWDAQNPKARVAGTLGRKKAGRLSVMVSADFPPFLQTTPLNLDAEAPEITFERGHRALNEFSNDPELAELSQVLFGKRAPSQNESPEEIEFRDPALNPSQREAVRFALASQDVALIHGPPGTGKTHTLVEVVRQLIRRGDSVLVATASNTALDNLAERLMQSGLKPVRVGHPERISAAVEERSLEKLIEETKEHQQAKRWLSEAFEKRERHEKRRQAGARSAASRGLLEEANALTRDARKLFQAARAKVLRRFKVILSTASGVDPNILGTHRFDTLVGLDDDLFAREMPGQCATIDMTLLCARRFQRRVRPFRLHLALGKRLLDVFERQLELIGMGRFLGASAEQGPLQLLDDRPQLLVLPGQLGGRGPFSQEQGLERRHVGRQQVALGRAGGIAHRPSESYRTSSVTY